MLNLICFINFTLVALLWATVAILMIVMVWGIKCIFRDRYLTCQFFNWFTNSETPEASLLITPDSSIQQSNHFSRYRIRCLDTFRGYVWLNYRRNTLHQISNKIYIQKAYNYLHDNRQLWWRRILVLRTLSVEWTLGCWCNFSLVNCKV